MDLVECWSSIDVKKYTEMICGVNSKNYIGTRNVFTKIINLDDLYYSMGKFSRRQIDYFF